MSLIDLMLISLASAATTPTTVWSCLREGDQRVLHEQISQQSFYDFSVQVISSQAGYLYLWHFYGNGLGDRRYPQSSDHDLILPSKVTKVGMRLEAGQNDFYAVFSLSPLASTEVRALIWATGHDQPGYIPLGIDLISGYQWQLDRVPQPASVHTRTLSQNGCREFEATGPGAVVVWTSVTQQAP